MASSEDLRRNKEQHKPKNEDSKRDDSAICAAMVETQSYLEERFSDMLGNYALEYVSQVSYEQLIGLIAASGRRHEFEMAFNNRTIRPDGGIIWLTKKGDNKYRKIIVVSEAKKQGTNEDRIKEGKKKQAQGNAIERLGKNLTGIKAALNHEILTPFVCFGWGCDFKEDYADDFVMAKISMLNEFYPLNRTYVFKKDGSLDKNYFSPVSMYFRERQWTKDEMYNILKEVAETSLRYYLF